jgi:hypothetical protein
MELRAYRHPLERDAALQRRRPRWGGGEEEALEETLRDSGGGRREAATGWGGGRGGEAHGAGRRVKKSVIRGAGNRGRAAVAAWRSLALTGGARRRPSGSLV